MSEKMLNLLDKAIDNLKAAGLFKPEFGLKSAQGHRIEINDQRYLNMTSNDYLGLATNERVQKAALQAMQRYGTGVSSPRAISGTQTPHQELEAELAKFFGKESSMLFSSSYDSNFGFFEPLFNDQDYIFCDIYAHPSIVDGIYRTPAQKMFYLRNDVNDLEDQLKRSPRARFRLIVVEGVYAMDGQVAELKKIVDLAKQYDALVMLHDPHGIGVLGKEGKGSAEFCEVLEQIDLISGSFCYALSGVDVGFIIGPQTMIDWLKQNSKPYVFCVSPSPMALGAAQEALRMIPEMKKEREALQTNSQDLRSRLAKLGYTTVKSPHPIIAVVTNDAVKTQKLADALFDDGIFALGLCYPIVPKGFARIRLQLNAGHTDRDVSQIVNALERHGQTQKILKKTT